MTNPKCKLVLVVNRTSLTLLFGLVLFFHGDPSLILSAPSLVLCHWHWMCFHHNATVFKQSICCFMSTQRDESLSCPHAEGMPQVTTTAVELWNQFLKQPCHHFSHKNDLSLSHVLQLQTTLASVVMCPTDHKSRFLLQSQTFGLGPA